MQKKNFAVCSVRQRMGFVGQRLSGGSGSEDPFSEAGELKAYDRHGGHHRTGTNENRGLREKDAHEVM